MNIPPRILLAFPTLLLAGCESSPVANPDPCDAEHACEVTGVDVALLSVIPRWTASQPYHDGPDAHVVEPGDTLVVDVVVVNRGTVEGTDSILVYGYFRDFQHFVSAARRIPPLEVGSTSTVTLRFAVPEGVRWVTEPWSISVAEGLFALDGVEDEDVDPSNHVGAAVEYHPRAAILDVELFDFPDTMRTHRPYDRTIEVANRSEFVSYAGGDELSFCMNHLGHEYCENGVVASHSPTAIGPVGAERTAQFSTIMAFTGESLWHFASENHVMVEPCLPGAERLICLYHADSADDYDVVAIPDLTRECHTAALFPPDTLRAVDALCLGDGANEGTAYTIGVFAGQAGDCYRLSGVGDGWIASLRHMNLAVVPFDHDADCLRLPGDGDYYLIAYSVGTSNPTGGIIAIDPLPIAAAATN